MPAKDLRISVVIPVLNGAAYLGAALQALASSSRIPDEIIVVDDGSTDDSVRIAEDFGATVMCTAGRAGPAAGRCLGAREAIGDVLLFVDADVLVHHDTIAKVAEVMTSEPSVAAVFGSYDDKPCATNFISQWKNLSHHFFHQNASENAQTFWSGCGAIRKSVFLAVGGFDLKYRGATIEDIEFGYRLRQRGYRVLLRKDILCTHQKVWEPFRTWKTDLFYRGIPWVRLILRSGVMPDDLNVSGSQRISTAIAWIQVALFVAASLSLPLQSIVGVGMFLMLLSHRYWAELRSDRAAWRRWLFPLAVNASCIAISLSFGLPLFAAAFGLGLVLMFCFQSRVIRSGDVLETTAYAFYFGISLAALALDLPINRIILVIASAGIVLAGLNQPYFSFFLKHRGLAFTAAVLPFQFAYYFLNGLAVIVGTSLWLARTPAVVIRRTLRNALRRESS